MFYFFFQEKIERKIKYTNQSFYRFSGKFLISNYIKFKVHPPLLIT